MPKQRVKLSAAAVREFLHQMEEEKGSRCGSFFKTKKKKRKEKKRKKRKKKQGFYIIAIELMAGNVAVPTYPAWLTYSPHPILYFSLVLP
jgi:hypothetical protein